MAFTQANRHLRVTTPLGTDALLLTDLSGHEGLSRLFTFDLQLLSERADLDFDAIVGKGVTATIDMEGGQRHFHGIVSRFAQSGTATDFATFEAQIFPWFWFLTRTRDCRIFQNLSVPDVVKKLFGEYGFTDYAFRLQGSYAKRDYCVQYRESDYDFISRLLEEEGIFYFFEHEMGKHTLVLGDTPEEHKPCPGQSRVRLIHSGEGVHEEDAVTSLRKEQEIRSGKYSTTDYNFEKPTISLAATATGKDSRQYETYDVPGFPGENAQRDQLERFARIRQQESDTGRIVYTGVGYRRSFTAGYRFDLRADPPASPNKSFNGTYVLTAVRHHAREGYGTDDTEIAYTNDFECIAAAVPFRPLRLTPRPAIVGVQTAVVVGPGGEEIFVDKYGRVKVQFHWDREGKHNENSSCWIRVSQPWAGKGWGGVSIPRIGQEVIVSFVEGDPDRPIITGRVYNAGQMPPYGLPAGGVVSGLKSQTHKGTGYNELSMDDTAGKEKITIHGQYDMNSTIEHDQTTTVRNNRTDKIDVDDSETVGKNQTLKVGADRTVTIGTNLSESVGGSRTRTVSKNETVTVALTRTHSVGVNEAIQVGAAQQVTVGGARTVSVGGPQTVSVGGTHTISVGKAQTLNVGADLSENVAKNHNAKVGGDRSADVAKNDSLKVGKKLSADAGDEIVLTTGQSSITMKKDGTIVIKGKAITIDAMQKIEEKAMNITSEAQTNNETKGAMVTVEASGVNTIKGSLVKIN
jgi:type VI secretion system secreted protein VgrG